MSNQNETKIMNENGISRRAESVEDLAQKVNGRVEDIIQGQQWHYAIISTKTNIQIVKYSPKTKHQLYTRGYIAVNFEDATKVFQRALELTKEVMKQRLLEKAKELGIQL